MRKYIWILNALELMTKLIAGKRVEGVLYIDEETGRLTFKAYNRQPRDRHERARTSDLPIGERLAEGVAAALQVLHQRQEDFRSPTGRRGDAS